MAVERFVRYNWQGLPEEKAERFGTLVDEDTVAGEEFVTAYPAYDRQGNLRAMTYPSGQAVAWEYQDGGTLREVGDGTRAIFSNLTYAAHGAVAGMRLGDAATGQAGWGQAFDPARLWPVRIVAGTTAVTANTSTASGAVLFGLDYDNYEANGNIAAVTRTLRTGAYGTPYTMDFAYTYDRLNRLAGCAVAGAEYNYAMDEFGNITARTRAAGGGGDLPSSLALVVNRATNRLGGAGYYHDVLGNLVTMPAADGVGTVSMTYLDQGHIGTLTDAAGVVWKYYYDADGKRRIKVKTAGGAATEPDGQGGVRLVADHSFYFYEGEDLICQQDMGALVARIPGTDDIDESVYEPKFLLLDHLGSTRAELVFTDSGGTFVPVIQEYYDLMPYGEVIDPPTTQESVLFTGKPRDEESGLDNYGARYYSDIGRMMSVDPVTVTSTRITNPQSLNLYSYVGNNPMNRIDPDGRDYYDQEGHRLGTDGNNEGKHYIVTNKKQISAINKRDDKGGVTPLNEVSSAIALPNANVRAAIGVAVDRSNAPTSDDLNGKQHEEGLLWGENYDGTTGIAVAVPGRASTPENGAEINLFNFADPIAAGNIKTLQGTAHAHPAGEVSVDTSMGGTETRIGGTVGQRFEQEPVKNDLPFASRFPQYNTLLLALVIIESIFTMEMGHMLIFH